MITILALSNVSAAGSLKNCISSRQDKDKKKSEPTYIGFEEILNKQIEKLGKEKALDENRQGQRSKPEIKSL